MPDAVTSGARLQRAGPDQSAGQSLTEAIRWACHEELAVGRKEPTHGRMGLDSFYALGTEIRSPRVDGKITFPGVCNNLTITLDRSLPPHTAILSANVHVPMSSVDAPVTVRLSA